jgi:hypothetical protein
VAMDITRKSRIRAAIVVLEKHFMTGPFVPMRSGIAYRLVGYRDGDHTCW